MRARRRPPGTHFCARLLSKFGDECDAEDGGSER